MTERSQLVRWGLVPLAFLAGAVVVPAVTFAINMLFVGFCFPVVHEFLARIMQSGTAGVCAVLFSYWAAPSHQRETAIVAATVLVTASLLLGLGGNADLFTWFHLIITGAVAIGAAVTVAREERMGRLR